MNEESTGFLYTVKYMFYILSSWCAETRSYCKHSQSDWLLKTLQSKVCVQCFVVQHEEVADFLGVFCLCASLVCWLCVVCRTVGKQVYRKRADSVDTPTHPEAQQFMCVLICSIDQQAVELIH